MKYAFLNIINTVIHQTPLQLTQPVEYAKILSMAKTHNIFPLVYEKLCEDSDFFKNSQFNEYMITAAGAMTAQARRTEAFLELYKGFKDNDVYPIVMKGIVCRQLYGELCDHRPSGDEDILVRKADFGKARAVLESQGYVAELENVSEHQLDELQEISFYNNDKKLHIELHLNPMGNENNVRMRMNEYFRNVFENAIDIECGGVKIRTMSHTDHFLFLVLHAFKHFTSEGFGIRQSMDILLYEEKYGKEINRKFLHKALQDVGAEAFYSDLVHIGNIYLGFCLQAPFEAKCPEELLEDMLRNGTFGNETQVQRTAASMTTAAVSGKRNGKKHRKIATYIYTIFPKRSQMVNEYMELSNKPWLLPICWVKRWCRFLKHNKQNDGNLVKESMEISVRRMELLKKYDVL